MSTPSVAGRLIAERDEAYAKLADTAAFLDRMAERLQYKDGPLLGYTAQQEQAAADCRALAEKLRK